MSKVIFNADRCEVQIKFDADKLFRSLISLYGGINKKKVFGDKLHELKDILFNSIFGVKFNLILKAEVILHFIPILFFERKLHKWNCYWRTLERVIKLTFNFLVVKVVFIFNWPREYFFSWLNWSLNICHLQK